MAAVKRTFERVGLLLMVGDGDGDGFGDAVSECATDGGQTFTKVLPPIMLTRRFFLNWRIVT